jgi:RNA polymerase sigma factor (sigma-70 family)
MRYVRWSEASDAALLSASRSDPDAFMAFYERYESAVIGYMFRRTRNTEVAIDLASEAFAAALAAAHRYRATGETAAPWLFTIAQNTLTDSLRRGQVEARARKCIGIRDAVEYTTDELERIEALASQTDWATELLETLPGDQQDAIRARVLDERPYRDIAREMKTSELVVRKRVSRGLAALREDLEEPT